MRQETCLPQWMEFENVVYKMAAILSRSEFVKIVRYNGKWVSIVAADGLVL